MCVVYVCGAGDSVCVCVCVCVCMRVCGCVSVCVCVCGVELVSITHYVTKPCRDAFGLELPPLFSLVCLLWRDSRV